MNRRHTGITLALFTLLPILSSTAQAVPKPKISAVLNETALAPGQQSVLAIVIHVPPGYHIQSDQPLAKSFKATLVNVTENPAITTSDPVFPKAEIKDYPALGKLSVFEGKVVIYLPLQVKTDAADGAIKLAGTVRYQMCDDRVCYQPKTVPWELTTSILPARQSPRPNEPDLFKNYTAAPATTQATTTPSAPPASTGPTIFGTQLTAGSLFPFIAAFLIGIIFNVMPCVLPVVPLKIMGFYEVSQHSRAKSLLFATIFSLGMVTVFAALGWFVVLPGRDWGMLFANTWFLGGIVALLLIFGLGQFGAFNVGLPVWVYNFNPRHDSYVGNFLFGGFTAILSTPCTFGMFFALLIWAASQPPAIGMSLMITVGAGMAFPYLALSAFPEVASRFPRTGPWAELVKRMMAFLLIGSAVFFARRFISAVVGSTIFWWFLFAVVVVAAVYLIIKSIQFSKTLAPRLAAVVVALLFVAPALAFTIRQTNPPLEWQPYSPETLASARKANRIVMLEFTADWCSNCLALEATVFHDKRFVEAVRRHEVVTLRADLSRDDAPGWAALKEITPIGAIPLTAIYTPGQSKPVLLSGIYSTSDAIAVFRDSPGLASRGQ